MRRTFTAGPVACYLLIAPAVAFGMRFAAAPQAELSEGGVDITFAVPEATDVEVSILDGNNHVVRHLAAGRLGGEDPPTPFSGGLSQSLTWDMQNDDGKPAGDGPFRVRVSLGLTAKFDKVIGWSGQSLDGVRGLVCGRDGTLFVVYGGALYAHRQTTLISAFDREGRYRYQVFPGPANLPVEQRRGWPHVKRDDGRDVPVVYHLLSRCIYPGAVFGNRAIPTITGDGRLVFVSGANTGSTIKHPDVRGGRRLLILGRDGRVPEDFLGPVIAPEHYGGFGRVAISTDDTFAYVSGLFEGGKDGRGVCNVVWRVAMDGSKPAEVFLGKLFDSGGGAERLNDPQGLAADADGNLYVADYGNNRVAIFNSDGGPIGELPVDRPDTVLVSRKTGAVYVMCVEDRTEVVRDQRYYNNSFAWRPSKVVKFASRDARLPQAELSDLLMGKYGGGAHLALDESADPPVLWISGRGYLGGDVYKAVDNGDRLEIVGQPISKLRAPADQLLPFVGSVSVLGNKVLARHPTFAQPISPESLAFDVATGEPLKPYTPKTAEGKKENYWNLVYGECTGGKDGRLYVHTSRVVRRFGPTGEPVPFAVTGTHDIPEMLFDRHTTNATLFVTKQGTIYAAVRKTEGGQARDEDVLCIRKISAEGNVQDDCVVSVQAARLGGLVVDSKGNLYLGAQVFADGHRIPEWVRGKLPADSDQHHPSSAYANCGAIVKFPPGGGSIRMMSDSPYRGHRQSERPVSVTGKIIARAGLVPGKVSRLGLGCNCEVTRFDIDPFDRLYVPDPLRFCVLVLDRQGNEITRFGTYGNMDSRGPGSPVATPDIPLGWPLTACHADGRVFVADLVNRRLVAVTLEHTVSETCDIKSP